VKRNPEAWSRLQKSLEEVQRTTEITPQFSEDIDRWSSIALPERKSRLYRRIGKITIKLLDPSLWAIGKLSRNLRTDEMDLVRVFKLVKSDPKKMARVWGRALKASPPSSAQSLFRRNVDHFFERFAQEIWGRKTDGEKLKSIFSSAAQKVKPFHVLKRRPSPGTGEGRVRD
jgi:hypothetical protein